MTRYTRACARARITLPNSNRMKWPFPAENQDPWYDAFSDMVTAIDASGHAAREDRSVFMGGGGDVSFNSTTGELAWTEAFEVYSTEVGFLFTLPAGSVILQDGELFYIDLVRVPTTNMTVAAIVASQVPQSDVAYVIGLRRSDDVYFRFGSKISNGETFNIFQGGGGGGSAGDTYERTATFTIPDGSSANLAATMGRTTYGGSIVGLSLEITEPVIGGTVNVKIQRNGFDTLEATLDTGNPSSVQATAVIGTWVTTPNDAITVVVDPTGYDNLSGLNGGLTVNVTFTTGLTLGPTEIPDATNAVKGIAKLATAADVANDPIVVGDNDPRVEGFTRIGTEVLLQTATDTVRSGPIKMDQNVALNQFLEAAGGSAAAVSPANRGRIRYNEGTNKWEFSNNGGAYEEFGSGSGWYRDGTVVKLVTGTDTVEVHQGSVTSVVYPGAITIHSDTHPWLEVVNGLAGGVEMEMYAGATGDFVVGGWLGTVTNHPLVLYANDSRQWQIDPTSGNMFPDRNGQALQASEIDFTVTPGGAYTNNFLAGGAGSTAPVSDASTGRIRYNESLQKWQFSENGAAYEDFGTGSSASSYVETATFGLAEGTTTQEATLGRVTYSGYLIGLSVQASDATTAGFVDIHVKVNAVTKLSAQINLGSPSSDFDTAALGTHALAQDDEITVEVVGDSTYTNALGGVTGLVVNVTMTDSVGATGSPNFALLDASQTFTKSQSVAQITLADGPGIAVDGDTSNNFEVELTQNSDLANPTNVVAGQTINIAVRQDGTGGWTLGFGSAYKFPGGAPTVSAGLNEEDIISCYVRAEAAGVATVMLCSIAQDHT